VRTPGKTLGLPKCATCGCSGECHDLIGEMGECLECDDCRHYVELRDEFDRERTATCRCPGDTCRC
jgi:hypothetical protein